VLEESLNLASFPTFFVFSSLDVDDRAVETERKK